MPKGRKGLQLTMPQKELSLRELRLLRRMGWSLGAGGVYAVTCQRVLACCVSEGGVRGHLPLPGGTQVRLAVAVTCPLARGYANGLAVPADLPPPEDGVVVLWLSFLHILGCPHSWENSCTQMGMFAGALFKSLHAPLGHVLGKGGDWGLHSGAWSTNQVIG